MFNIVVSAFFTTINATDFFLSYNNINIGTVMGQTVHIQTGYEKKFEPNYYVSTVVWLSCRMRSTGNITTSVCALPFDCTLPFLPLYNYNSISDNIIFS